MNDSSHLYHDSHFAGEALEVRERMKARWVNAREERLLAQQDYQLQRAKETCRKRACWEQDSVRRDLGVILARTPLFHSTVRDEKDKLMRRRRQSLHRMMSDTTESSPRRTNKGVVASVTFGNYPPRLNKSTGSLPLQLPSPTKNGAVTALDNLGRLGHLSGTIQMLQPSESPSNLSPEKTRLPAISTGNVDAERTPVGLELETLYEDTMNQTDEADNPASSDEATTSYAVRDHHPVDGTGNFQTSTVPGNAPEHQSYSYNYQATTSNRAQYQSRPTKPEASVRETTSVHVNGMMPLARSIQRDHKYRYPGQPPPATQAHPNNTKTQSAPSTLPAAFDLPEDSMSHGNYRGAELRRRCHHAVMAIVRVQTRKEQRLRAGSEATDTVTLPPAAGPRGTGDAARQYRFSGPSSKSIADLSRWMPMSTQDPAQSRSHPGSVNPRQKQSWLSFPLPDL